MSLSLFRGMEKGGADGGDGELKPGILYVLKEGRLFVCYVDRRVVLLVSS